MSTQDARAACASSVPTRPSDYPSAAPFVVLSPESIEQIARRVVELLAGPNGDRPNALVDAQAVAEALGVDRGWVYEHAVELGGVRLGDGSRPRLRFDLEAARAAVACGAHRRSQVQSAPVAEPNVPSRRRTGSGTSVPLLPIRPRGRRS